MFEGKEYIKFKDGYDQNRSYSKDREGYEQIEYKFEEILGYISSSKEYFLKYRKENEGKTGVSEDYKSEQEKKLAKNTSILADLLKKLSDAKEKIKNDNHEEALDLNKRYDKLIKKINQAEHDLAKFTWNTGVSGERHPLRKSYGKDVSGRK